MQASRSRHAHLSLLFSLLVVAAAALVLQRFAIPLA